MKKVRFETPKYCLTARMNESECHSPRPCLEKQVCANIPNIDGLSRVVPFSQDPIQRFEYSNSSPYPIAMKTNLPDSTQRHVCKLASNELDLSMLDTMGPNYKQSFSKTVFQSSNANTPLSQREVIIPKLNTPPVFTGVQNRNIPPNVLTKDNDFFIRRDNMHQIKLNALHEQFNCVSLDKENKPLNKKVQIFDRLSSNTIQKERELFEKPLPFQETVNQYIMDDCRCHHCVQVVQNTHHNFSPNLSNQNVRYDEPTSSHCLCNLPQPKKSQWCNCHYRPKKHICTCNIESGTPKHSPVDKKTWAIEKYEQMKTPENMELEKQDNVHKVKKEPTVADLFKIIKLQNEQLQILQEKVDKFISSNQQKEVSEGMLKQVLNEEHKISIGVMTSFEVVRTSTVVNKEIVSQTKDSSQVQCNKSQISVKGVVANAQPVNLNFLEGITPVTNAVEKVENCMENQLNDEKTFNEFSLYNVQVDNATTPMISPEHSMYLDVRDYSDSEASGDDQSNVGWTYYNKVMTHVNGVLQDSDMPSSASALYRNTKQQCIQMQIDKTNLSVTKRVKFGDDPLGIHQPHIYTASTDTSLKMNQLAAKYLQKAQPPLVQHQVPKQVTLPNNMSFATQNYMERHKLMQGSSLPLRELPKFLDINALKCQPKQI